MRSARCEPEATPRWSAPYVATILLLDVAAFLYATKLLGPTPIYHDNGYYAYPLRVFLSTAVRHGTLPLWDQWTHAGVPFCSLASGLSLSPIALILSALGIYSVKTFVAEIVIVHVLALLGMFKWLRTLVDADAALLGAVCYSLSAILLIQTPINVEGIVSQAMFPWYVLGLKRSLQGRQGGIALIAVSLWIMFTSGYLGLNVFAVEALSLYALADHLLVDSRAVPRGIGYRGAAYVCAGWCLFAGIVSFALLESYSHFRFDFAQIRQTSFDPFTGSARPDSAYTLLWPNYTFPFNEDASGAHVFPIYSGAITYLLMFGALPYVKPPGRTGEGTRVVVLLAFSLVAFLATMSGKSGGAMFTAIMPLYDKVRFHCWGLSVVVFLTISLASLGLKRLRDEGGMSAGYIGASAICAAAMLLAQRGWRGVPAVLSYPQLYLLLPLAFAVSVRFRWSWRSRVRVLLALTLIEVVAVSPQNLALGQVPFEGTNALRALEWETVARNDALKTVDFPTPGNERTATDKGNRQYFTKTPSFSGYNPNIHPAIKRLQSDPHFRELLDRVFYPSDKEGRPLLDGTAKIELRRFMPNVVEASIQSRDGPVSMTWSSPFTTFWKLRIDGVPTETRENAFGLTTFAVPEGRHVMKLRYRPPYLALSTTISGASLFVAMLLAVREVRTTPRPGDSEFGA